MSSETERPFCERYIPAPGILTLSEGGGTKFVRHFPAISIKNIPPYVDLRNFPYRKDTQLFDKDISIEETTSFAFELKSPVFSPTTRLTQWKDKDGSTHYYRLELYPDLDPKKLKEIYKEEWEQAFIMFGDLVEEIQPRCMIEPPHSRLLINLNHPTGQGNESKTVELVKIGQFGELTFNPSFIDKANTQGRWYKGTQGTLRYRTDLRQLPHYMELVLGQIQDANKRLIILGYTFNPQAFAHTLACQPAPLNQKGELDESYFRGVINPYFRISRASS